MAAREDSRHRSQNSGWGKGEKVNEYQDITTYNNFYEFGTEKDDPAANAHSLKTTPWKVKIDGLVGKPADYNLEDIVKPQALEERIYRLRCVERWSMVIPWIGFPLASLLKRIEPRSTAKFVEFTTLLNPQQMPGQRRQVLEWPYTEGLRLDEAMHPLTILAVGLYGEYLPNQNGAPIRLVVPWKYGFKSIKSIVRIRLTDRAADEQLAAERAERVRVLFERQSRARSSAMVAGARAAHRRVPHAADADVQRIRRSGGVAVLRNGSEEILLKPLVFAAALVPFAHLMWRGFNGDLTADPLVEITNETGIWTLRFVVITLAITPIRRLTGWNADDPLPAHARAVRVLLCACCTSSRISSAIGSRASIFRTGSSPGARSSTCMASIWEDVAKRPYITVGFIAFVVDDSAGAHLDDRMDSPARRPQLAAAAPA